MLAPTARTILARKVDLLLTFKHGRGQTARVGNDEHGQERYEEVVEGGVVVVEKLLLFSVKVILEVGHIPLLDSLLNILLFRYFLLICTFFLVTPATTY